MASLSTPSHFSSYFSCHIPRTHCIFKPHWFLLSVVPLLTSKPATQRQHCFPWAFNTVAVFNYLICEQILLAKHMLSKGNTDRKPKPRGPQIGGTKLQSRFIPSAVQFSSVQFSRSVVSNSLQPHESQNARPPSPSPTPGIYSDSCPSSRWCHPAISSSAIPFYYWTQSLTASGSFTQSSLEHHRFTAYCGLMNECSGPSDSVSPNNYLHQLI